MIITSLKTRRESIRAQVKSSLGHSFNSSGGPDIMPAKGCKVNESGPFPESLLPENEYPGAMVLPPGKIVYLKVAMKIHEFFSICLERLFEELSNRLDLKSFHCLPFLLPSQISS